MNPGTYRFQLGRFGCIAILDDLPRYPIDMFLTNLSKATYAPLLAARGEDVDFVDLPYTCLFVDTGRLRVLVDTGSGVNSDRPTSGQLLPLLRAHGVQPDQIDLVILTHGHGDHVGGCLDASGRPVFSNARHVLSRREWDFWMSEPALDELPVDEAFKRRMLTSVLTNLRGVQQQLELIQLDAELAPGVNAIDAFGHSPGHMAVEMTSDGERLLFVADAIVLPLHAEYPETIGVTDHQRDETVATRIRLLEYAARERALVATSHLAFPGVGHVRPKGRRWQWQAVGISASV